MRANKLPALYGRPDVKTHGQFEFGANSRLEMLQKQLFSVATGKPIVGWFANLPEGEKILHGNRYLHVDHVVWPSDLVRCPFCKKRGMLDVPLA